MQIPRTIREDEKGYYHILMITSTPNMATQEFEHHARVVKKNIESYEATKKNLSLFGTPVIFHNPTEKATK